MAKRVGITAAEAAAAILTKSSLPDTVDSLASTLSTNEELNAGRAVFHPLAEWLRRAREKGIAYLPSLDWAVEQSNQAAAQSATAHSDAPGKGESPNTVTTGLVNWQGAALEAWSKIIEKHGIGVSAREAMKWLKDNGPRDVFGCPQPNRNAL